jgi:hypothetical protein
MMSVTVPANGCGPEVDQISTGPGAPTVLKCWSMMFGGEPGMVDVTVMK